MGSHRDIRSDLPWKTAKPLDFELVLRERKVHSCYRMMLVNAVRLVLIARVGAVRVPPGPRRGEP